MNELILTEIKNTLGIITLNSPKSLNSLSIEMASTLFPLLDEWKTNDNIQAIFLQGSGDKAFCAGGDIVKMYQAMNQAMNQTMNQTMKDNKTDTPSQTCIDFFTTEYQLDYTIHTYPKPIFVWGHGIVMGGGLGLMVGASHRIVTEKSKIAMPEITIGLYPDVAGTWFLNKMPSGWGIFLGLTGMRLNAADCLYLGLADYYIESSDKDKLMASLQNNPNDIPKQLLKHQESELLKYADIISHFDNVDSIDEFQNKALEILPRDSILWEAYSNFEKGSPTSARLIIEQLKRGKNKSLAHVFKSELNLSVQITRHPDFKEGIRALLIDKDGSPNWYPKEKINNEWIENHFKPLWSENNHPLKNLNK